MTETRDTNNEAEDDSKLRAKSNDVGWLYGIKLHPQNSDRLKCTLCEHVMSGGIYRMKQHIAHVKGNVASCKKSKIEDKEKCLKALDEIQMKKKQKVQLEKEAMKEVSIDDKNEIQMEEEYDGPSEPETRMKKQMYLGPMDRYTSNIDPKKTTTQTQSQNVNNAIYKERSLKVDQYVARYMFECAIPFNVVEHDSFKRMIEAVGQFGPSYKTPTRYKLSGPLLKGEVERTKGLMKKQEEEWKKNGCSIMTDAWSDRKRRSIMNLCVNCSEGTAFLTSMEASKDAHTGKYIFDYVDKCIEEIGANYIVQIVTDNASNNMAAKALLKVKRPTIFWSSCASHTINLMLQEIATLPKFMGVVDKAKSFTIFLYAHHKLLHLMRKFTNRRDIVRPGVTRFATAFLSLQSIMEKKNALRTMFTSVEWSESPHSKTKRGKAAENLVITPSFWHGVGMCLNIFAPLFKVLRLVDGDQRPTMGFVYGEILKARADIKRVYRDQEMHYGPIIEIMDKKGRDRLDSPLHLAAYLVNPYYTYNDPDIENDAVVMCGFMECIDIMFGDDVGTKKKVMDVDLHKYLGKEGMFGCPFALNACAQSNENYNPVGWWNIYGKQVPSLQYFAKRVIGLTSSSSGCERAWSTFEGIHTKKRNRLEIEKLNNLVFVQFNAKLFNKRQRQVEHKDVLLSDDVLDAQDWLVNPTRIVEGDDENVATPLLVRDLDDDFISDKEEEEDDNYEFDDENEGVLQVEQYGNDFEELG